MNNITIILEWLLNLLKAFSPAIYMVIGAFVVEYLRRKTSKSAEKKEAYSKLSELRFLIPSIVWTHQYSKIIFLFHHNQWALSKDEENKEFHYSQMMKHSHENLRFLETYNAKMGELYSTVAKLQTLIAFDSDGMRFLDRVRNLRLDFVQEEPRGMKTPDAIDGWRKNMTRALDKFIKTEYDGLFYDLTHYVKQRI